MQSIPSAVREVWYRFALYGREGEEEGDTSGKGESESSEGASGEEGSSHGSDDKPETFDRSYVEQLRRENANYRKRAQEAEAQLKSRQEEDMSELEKAQARATDSAERVSVLERQLTEERIERAVEMAALRLNFHDPTDAIRSLNASDLNIDEETGLPSVKSINGALERLAKAKPYLVKATSTGSADGGAGGGPKKDQSPDDVTSSHLKTLQDGGSVTLPWARASRS